MNNNTLKSKLTFKNLDYDTLEKKLEEKNKIAETPFMHLPLIANKKGDKDGKASRNNITYQQESLL